MMKTENKITKSKNVLYIISAQDNAELVYLKDNFCGSVFTKITDMDSHCDKSIYICGDLENIQNIQLPKNTKVTIYVITELSINFKHLQVVKISLGKVPVIIRHAGVYFRKLFDGENYFHSVQAEHAFQALTESTKSSTAFRKGIYLTPVKKQKTQLGDGLSYFLLRCSSNLSGATDNFRTTDHSIINTLTQAVTRVFEQRTSLNHVLAQVYFNQKLESGKEAKAKIKAHADKTKDMPTEGLIAFCTFYDESEFTALIPSKTDRFDWCYKDRSGLTRLLFKLKNTVDDETLAKEFSVTLYPNSAFIIPLSTNRLYTHEIRPSAHNTDKIPTRLGYVVRCSNCEAVYVNDQTYIKENGELIKLEKMNNALMNELRTSYLQENKTQDKVAYGDVRFSMNTGDYKQPIL